MQSHKDSKFKKYKNMLLLSPDGRENPFCSFFKNKKIGMTAGTICLNQNRLFAPKINPKFSVFRLLEPQKLETWHK
jgi:hypothetical protein